jgi:hypothetical protein
MAVVNFFSDESFCCIAAGVVVVWGCWLQAETSVLNANIRMNNTMVWKLAERDLVFFIGGFDLFMISMDQM